MCAENKYLTEDGTVLIEKHIHFIDPALPLIKGANENEVGNCVVMFFCIYDSSIFNGFDEWLIDEFESGRGAWMIGGRTDLRLAINLNRRRELSNYSC